MWMLDIDLALASVAAFAVGLKVKTWRSALCLLIAALAWAIRAVVILNGDVTTAEDYINGLDVRTAAAEIAVIVVWTGLCALLGIATAHLVARRKASLE